MIKSFFSFLHRFFFSDDDPFKKPANFEPYNETIIESVKPVRKRASRKKPAPMAIYKNKKKTIRKKAA